MVRPLHAFGTMCNLSPKIRQLLDTGISLGEVSSRNLGGTQLERVCRVCKEAILSGFNIPEQILAYASSNLPGTTKEDVQIALNHLCVKKRIVRSDGKYMIR